MQKCQVFLLRATRQLTIGSALQWLGLFKLKEQTTNSVCIRNQTHSCLSFSFAGRYGREWTYEWDPSQAREVDTILEPGPQRSSEVSPSHTKGPAFFILQMALEEPRNPPRRRAVSPSRCHRAREECSGFQTALAPTWSSHSHKCDSASNCFGK